jgi:hypothetical protein
MHLFNNLVLFTSLSISASFAQFNNGTSTFGCVFLRSDQLDICTSDKPFICCTLSNETAIAWGVFSDGIEVIPAAGWAQLAIHTSSLFPELLQAQAAGFLEGYLTASRSFEFITNVHNGISTWSPALKQYVTENIAYVSESVKSNQGDPFWFHIGLVFAQQKSAFEGYILAATRTGSPKVDSDAYYAATLIGDMDDLCVKFGCSKTSTWRSNRLLVNSSSTFDDNIIRYERSLSDGHCSALVKPIGDLDAPRDVFFGHTTWNPYETMTRIYKLYDFPWTISGIPGSSTVPGKQISFPSYPACFYSFDDYYTMYPSGIAVLETTIINNNSTLWDLLSPRSVSDWARNMVANRLADDGTSWASYFERENSGTYNNMFLVLDYNKVSISAIEKRPLQNGTLMIIEQMPGVVVITDASFHLQPLSYGGSGEGYYASYNRIQTPWLFNLTNQTALVDEYGDHFTYANYTRGKIFRDLHNTVIDETSYMNLMRYNSFQNDVYGTQGCLSNVRSGSNSISERGDLSSLSGCPIRELNRIDEGGIDLKFTNLGLMIGVNASISIAQNGPTTHGQEPFVWSTSPFASLSHIGQPDKFDFLPTYMSPDYPTDGKMSHIVGTLVE